MSGWSIASAADTVQTREGLSIAQNLRDGMRHVSGNRFTRREYVESQDRGAVCLKETPTASEKTLSSAISFVSWSFKSMA
jgi:hypothetical protein